jgi:proteasome lid subunit RPN8/RPN11
MGRKLNVSMSQELLATIFEGAKQLCPRESILFLRGKKSKDTLQIIELVIPPLAVHGHGFANVLLHMLPMDFSIVGTAHSHVSGNLSLSNVDFNHFFGKIIMIVGFPFINKDNIAVYDSKGEKLQLEITKE